MASGNVEDRVRALILPHLDDLGLELFDVEFNGGRLLITIDNEQGLDSGTLYHATRAISREMDESDPIPSAFTLEISSPGLERKLRRPSHWHRSIGDKVSIKVRQDFAAHRRMTGSIVSADDTAAVILVDTGDGNPIDAKELTVPFDVVQKAKTIFDWGPTPKKGGKANQSKSSSKKKQSDSEPTEKEADAS